MSASTTGGPAFPGRVSDPPGMDLRDYFAAQAMAGDWAACDANGGNFPNDIADHRLVDRAKLYYRMADAMLKARKT